MDIFIRIGLLGSLLCNHAATQDLDEIFVFYFCALLIGLSFLFKKVRKIDAKMLGVILLYTLATTLLNFRTPVRMNLLNMFFGISAIVIMAERITLNYKAIGKILIGFAIASNILIVCQLFHLDIKIFPPVDQISGLNFLPWMMGCEAVLMIPFIYLISPWFCLLLAPMIFFCKSITCMAIFSIVFTFMYSEDHKVFWKALIFFGVLTIIFASFLSHPIDQDRFRAVYGSFKYIHNSLIGNGIGSWAHEAFAIGSPGHAMHWRWAHIEPYQYLFEQGFIGLSLAVLFIIQLFKTHNRVLLNALTAIILLSLVHPIFHFGKFLFFIMLVFAMCLATTKEKVYGTIPR